MSVRGVYIEGEDGHVCCLLADRHVGAAGAATGPVVIGAKGRKIKNAVRKLARGTAKSSFVRAALAAATMSPVASPALKASLRAMSARIPQTPTNGAAVVVDPPQTEEELANLLDRAARASEPDEGATE